MKFHIFGSCPQALRADLPQPSYSDPFTLWNFALSGKMPSFFIALSRICTPATLRSCIFVLLSLLAEIQSFSNHTMSNYNGSKLGHQIFDLFFKIISLKFYFASITSINLVLKAEKISGNIQAYLAFLD